MTGHRVLDIATKPALLTVDQGGYRTVIKCECGQVLVASGEEIDQAEQLCDKRYGSHIHQAEVSDRIAARRASQWTWY